MRGVRAEDMRLKILRVSSPDLDPEIGGHPEDATDFEINVEVMLVAEGNEAQDVSFQFRCVSPSALARQQAGSFLSNILLMEEFSWQTVAHHIERLLMQVHSCKSWECVALRLSPYMRPFGVKLAETEL